MKYWRIGTSDSVTSFWGEMESEGKVNIGWPEIGDLSDVKKDKPTFMQLFANVGYFPDNKSSRSRKAGEVLNFCISVNEGDVVLAQDGDRVLGIGIVDGPYEFNEESDFPHQKRTKWVVKNPNLSNEIGRLTTVYKIENQSTISKINTLIHGQVFKSGYQSTNTNFKMSHPLNQILFGPPGTGKTYHTINRAIEIIENRKKEDVEAQDRKSLKESFDRYQKDGQIAFCTFHQSMSYEDFVEGIKPQEPEDGETFVQYKVEDGIFKQLALKASLSQDLKKEGSQIVSDVEFKKASFFKISLGGKGQTEIYDHCMANNVIAIGYGDLIDFSGVKDGTEVIERFRENGYEVKNRQDGQVAAVERFVLWPKKGDILLVANGNTRVKAIGMVEGDYYCDPNSKIGYNQFRKVRWLQKDVDIPVGAVYASNFMISAFYGLFDNKINKEFFTGKGNSYEEKWKTYIQDIKSLKTKEIRSEGYGIVYKLEVDDNEQLWLTNGNKKESKIDKNLILKGVVEKEGTPIERMKKVLPNQPTHTSWPAAVLSDFERFIHKTGTNQPHVLIIDEINRGNVSQIFGELITLIEEDKRAGKPEALEVFLPYSKTEPFSVPSNLYIIGTMNTADRSVEALDTALRRRFVFEEKGPQTNLITPSQIHRRFWNDWEPWPDIKEYDYDKVEKKLWDFLGVEFLDKEAYIKYGDTEVQSGFSLEEFESAIEGKLIYTGIDLSLLLTTINSRIEVLLSKDHQIGHSYFMRVFSEKDLKTAFYKSIIPLLQEYFYGDYGKIGLVLGRGFVETMTSQKPFANFDYEASETLSERVIYRITDYRMEGKEGFIEAVKAIYS
jgi:5-methylcytosine-specific restriction protein B